jgi:peptidoglycan/xylan/chitin deacetylase (PgdA/CDA1 family)
MAGLAAGGLGTVGGLAAGGLGAVGGLAAGGLLDDADAMPGTPVSALLLAHDTGHRDRLVAIRGLPTMIRGLRARGFEFVTVSDLLATATTART